MLCYHCRKKQATHCMKKGEEKIYLCESCFESLHGAGEYMLDPDFFESFFKEGIGDEGRCCPECGATLADYSKTGVLGCEKCYQTFLQELLPAIRKIHGKTKHTGKRPSEESTYYELLEEQRKLRLNLETALKEKRMQDADRINKDLRAINRIIYRGNYGENND